MAEQQDQALRLEQNSGQAIFLQMNALGIPTTVVSALKWKLELVSTYQCSPVSFETQQMNRKVSIKPHMCIKELPFASLNHS